MSSFDLAALVLAGIALSAAFVNGAIGYGFSSLTVPLALVFYTNRVLNPAIVVVEVLINFYVLFINLKGVPSVWRRVMPILIGLLPGIAIGSFALASLQPGWIKFCTYTVLLPLILLQAAGWRRPIESTWMVGLPFGSMLGVLYSVTTISGPPLAILFNNQGLVKNEFRAGLALVRVVESTVTAVAYYKLGLFIQESNNLMLVLIPSVLVGIPCGAYVIRRLDAETFRRICMSFDAWVVGFGLSRVLIELNLMQSPWAYSVMGATIVLDLYLLYIFFTAHRASPAERPQMAERSQALDRSQTVELR
ncbi:sulfite exporter TauE/SafE family protein [Bradyrhizobium sp.]|uniref:sulfite exporter TauE/SafE family protein n=1 Tax=Bradyrhizobium sp. TaxID=376 RepID=UPI001DDDCB4B|nr:sulfite exporter TauE/SafE family protein [Bradyrhizobium sp.]MBV8697631.1 sulfite exporter TauE/SafE family protein [Bradyrhizobium sp.]MBV8920164.1 sulfite exporter TauE/SafE family protein [Bradyrhizobium sp.]MBV9983449.1 sulfite exporter TauE/SafE family protein [Bradyrhizobium sp.]